MRVIASGEFYRLKYSEEECKRVMETVSTLYAPDAIVYLTKSATTEANVRAHSDFQERTPDRVLAFLVPWLCPARARHG